jgi:hypothetical protein
MAGMPRFRLRQLLLGVTLATVGFGMISFAIDPRGLNWPALFGGVPTLVVLCGCLAVGFGLTAPFRQPQIGLLLGMSCFFSIMIYYAKK